MVVLLIFYNDKNSMTMPSTLVKDIIGNGCFLEVVQSLYRMRLFQDAAAVWMRILLDNILRWPMFRSLQTSPIRNH